MLETLPLEINALAVAPEPVPSISTLGGVVYPEPSLYTSMAVTEYELLSAHHFHGYCDISRDDVFTGLARPSNAEYTGGKSKSVAADEYVSGVSYRLIYSLTVVLNGFTSLIYSW